MRDCCSETYSGLSILDYGLIKLWLSSLQLHVWCSYPVSYFVSSLFFIFTSLLTFKLSTHALLKIWWYWLRMNRKTLLTFAYCRARFSFRLVEVPWIPFTFYRARSKTLGVCKSVFLSVHATLMHCCFGNYMTCADGAKTNAKNFAKYCAPQYLYVYISASCISAQTRHN